MKNFWSDLREIIISFFQIFGGAWWVEIMTQKPHCTYYFGPFLSTAKSGYIEDLEQEGAQGIDIAVKRCKPSNLTIYDDTGEKINHKAVPVFSNQT